MDKPSGEPVIMASTFQKEGEHYFVRAVDMDKYISIQIYKDDSWKEIGKI